MDSQKLDAILREPRSYVLVYYGFAFVPKWPQKQPQSFESLKISWGSMPPDPPSLPCLCMHTYTSDTSSENPGYRPDSVSFITFTHYMLSYTSILEFHGTTAIQICSGINSQVSSFSFCILACFLANDYSTKQVSSINE